MNIATLFDSNKHDEMGANALPYWIAIQQLDDGDFPGWEVSAISHILEHEQAYYEGRGYLAGPVHLAIGQEQQEISAHPIPISVPAWVEEDGLKILACGAKSLIIVDRKADFDYLQQSIDLAEHGLLLMTGCGIPRALARRLIRRLRTEMGISVHLLGDNDTWTYFTWSVLKTGAVVPGYQIPFLAIDDIGFLGITASDVEQRFDLERFRRPWKKGWNERLAAMAEYPCFDTPEWCKEFKQFAEHGYAVDLSSILVQIEGEHFWNSFILPKLA
jgi:DNA topoisomerase VI subunit A